MQREKTVVSGSVEDDQLAPWRARLTGAVPKHRIRSAGPAPVSPETVARYLALPDIACAVADALDELRIGSPVTGGLSAVRGGSRVCGAAVTLRYERVDPAAAKRVSPVLGDRDLYGLAPAGAVAVIDAADQNDHAVVGEISMAWAATAGLAGIVVDGAVRDVDALTSEDALPVWSRARSPRNARGRLDAVELNGPIRLGGGSVRPGDLVVADGNGVAVVPAEHITDVLQRCERAHRTEARIHTAIAESADLADLVRRSRSVTETA
ncbi:RraA family protein [Actinomadura algeriensis]|uniref:Putative 4-hydroxy-4-methyl-2-oxoglutarate aldolase n=1 Tax=Actinomadura algeriensis TaxID=1679523 RepID=A0ABR9K3T2_9ACTN|nr:RraA family protein [Actinomadura algeriensis]MBE1537015.1 regulator of RNase E activity RraA [Actinomadura algeriensis]